MFKAFCTVSSAPDSILSKSVVMVIIPVASAVGITEIGTGNSDLTGVVPPNWKSYSGTPPP